jgi:hypothetical protein
MKYPTNNKYKLEGKKIVPVGDLLEWAKWFEEHHEEKVVARTHIKRPGGDQILISTVFLGLDHRFGQGDPVLFETMVFGGPLDQHQDRYTTYNKAELGHKKMVKKVFNALSAGRILAEET